jgi:hypothetical protein
MASAKRKSQQDLEKLDQQEFPEKIEIQPASPVMTINIHSWATPIVGIIMLVIGALAGFYVRPTVLGQLSDNPSETSPVVALPTEDRSADKQRLMASLIPKVRHFIGDSNAPVTIIEFGDFK